LFLISQPARLTADAVRSSSKAIDEFFQMPPLGVLPPWESIAVVHLPPMTPADYLVFGITDVCPPRFLFGIGFRIEFEIGRLDLFLCLC
jgi:hypothetical protein